jgi:hypothetical protein
MGVKLAEDVTDMTKQKPPTSPESKGICMDTIRRGTNVWAKKPEYRYKNGRGYKGELR